MKRGQRDRTQLKFLLIAVFIIVMADHFLFDGTRPYIEEARRTEIEKALKERDERLALLKKKEAQAKLARLEPQVNLSVKTVPQWQKNAVPIDVSTDKYKIAIVIDDVGASRRYAEEAIALPGPLTMAFLPYARNIDGFVAQAHKNGHEIMVHMPMEPMNSDLDTGDIVLRTDQKPKEFAAMLDKGLSAFDGYVGINNHMGSRLTQDKKAMQILMAELARRGLLFLDSRTIGSSVAAETAAAFDVPYAERDVFLDHDPSLEGVRKSLEKLEQVARDYGQAIAIGHPKGNTIQALKEWVPSLEEKNIALVPVSALVRTKPALASSGPLPAVQPQPPAQLHQ